MILNDVKNKRISRSRKRVGRGPGSGHGKTSGRGHKGTKSRTGVHFRPMFAGNMIPFFMKFPKRGMGKRFVRGFAVVNLAQLSRYASGESVDPARLEADRVVKTRGLPLKVLGNGRLETALTVKAHAFSRSAEEKIVAAGGSVVRLKAEAAQKNTKGE